MKNRPLLVVAIALVCLGSMAKADAPLVYCIGAEGGENGPRRYSYLVDSASFPMMEFRVGTKDLDPANYTRTLIPPGWSFDVEDRQMGHYCGRRTPHGEICVGGPCRCLTTGSVHWWTTDPSFAIEFYIFGYDHPWVSEDISWTLTTRREDPRPEEFVFREDWDSPVGRGLGPVHGPSRAAPRDPLPGDADRDGDVDRWDFAALELNFGMSSGAWWEQGDFTGDGATGWPDYLIWKANAGLTSTAHIPEPATLTLLTLGSCLSLLVRRKFTPGVARG